MLIDRTEKWRVHEHEKRNEINRRKKHMANSGDLKCKLSLVHGESNDNLHVIANLSRWLDLFAYCCRLMTHPIKISHSILFCCAAPPNQIEQLQNWKINLLHKLSDNCFCDQKCR